MIHSVTQSHMHSFPHPFTHLLINYSLRSLNHSFIHSFINLLIFFKNCASSASINKDEDCDLYAAPRGGVHPVSAATAVQLATKYTYV